MEHLNYKLWIEEDLNPFFVYKSNGKIDYLNQEAQYLLSKISHKEIYDIAIKYAPHTFGLEHKFLDINLILIKTNAYETIFQKTHNDGIHYVISF